MLAVNHCILPVLVCVMCLSCLCEIALHQSHKLRHQHYVLLRIIMCQYLSRHHLFFCCFKGFITFRGPTHLVLCCRRQLTINFMALVFYFLAILNLFHFGEFKKRKIHKNFPPFCNTCR